MAWILRLYDYEGRNVGLVNYPCQSFSVEMDAPNAETLRDTLSDCDEFGGFIRPAGGNEFGEEVVPIRDPQAVLTRIGSAMVDLGVVESYEVTIE